MEETMIEGAMNSMDAKVSKRAVLVISVLCSIISILCLSLLPKANAAAMDKAITENPTILKVQSDVGEVKEDIENMKKDVSRTMKLQIDDIISSGQAAVKNLEKITDAEKLIEKLSTSQNGNAMKIALRTPEARPIIYAMNHDLAVFCDEYFGPQATWEDD